MDFNTTAADVLRIAGAEEGTAESPSGSNKVKYNAWAGLQGEPWCATFVRWVLMECGVKAPFSSYVPNIKAVAKANGCWVDGGQLAQPGDIVCYGFPGESHTPNHTGFVKVVHGIRDITAVEGNTDAAGGRTGGKVMEKHRTADIDGYFRPTYKSATAEIGDDMPYIARLTKGFRYGNLDLGAGFCTYVAGPVRTDNPSAGLISEAQANGRQVVNMGPLEFEALLNSTVTKVQRLIAQGK